MTSASKITVRYSSVDGFSEKRAFKTISGARAYATSRVGPTAEVSSSGYAVSGDGVGKITVDGIGLRELLTGEKADAASGVFAVFVTYCHDGEPCVQASLRGRYESVDEQVQAFDHFSQHDDAEHYHYMADFKDGRWVPVVPLYNGKTAAEIMAETYPGGPF